MYIVNFYSLISASDNFLPTLEILSCEKGFWNKFIEEKEIGSKKVSFPGIKKGA